MARPPEREFDEPQQEPAPSPGARSGLPPPTPPPKPRSLPTPHRIPSRPPPPPEAAPAASSHYAPPHAPPQPRRLPTDPPLTVTELVAEGSLTETEEEEPQITVEPQVLEIVPPEIPVTAEEVVPELSALDEVVEDATSQAPSTPADLERALSGADYLPDQPTVVSLWLALRLDRPLLIEGPAGVGKTDLARAAALALGRPLIRLQCYEGLDESKALYEWDYGKQMLYTQLLRDAVAQRIDRAATITDAVDAIAGSGAGFFSDRFLIARPLLSALRSPTPAVLLLDEVDRSDPEFEAFLLEILSEFQVTIPELGTIEARHRPLVLLTTNGVRDMTDALRRRCLHLALDYPVPSREVAIVRMKVPQIDRALSARLVAFVHHVRALGLRKAPSIAETIDFARALVAFGARSLEPSLVQETMGILLKYGEDRAKVEPRVRELSQAAERDAERLA